MRAISPLRYPGGKSILADFLTNVIELNALQGCTYYEPYAGGAGAALKLLKEDVVSEIYINDADPRIHAFWYSVLNDSKDFVNEIRSVPLTMDEWYQQQEICENPTERDTFEVGFAAFYMNRCNRSGVLSGAGPIGGHEQSGKWRMDVRFNRAPLIERVLSISRLKKRIHLSSLDALEFLKTCLPGTRGRKNVFVYLDPPYVNKGQRLYLNAYDAKDHAKLARYIRAQSTLPWIMSYDDAGLVRELYADQQLAHLTIPYSLQDKRSANELIIAPEHVTIPRSCQISGKNALVRTIRG
jgi:DNA adenine methylase